MSDGFMDNRNENTSESMHPLIRALPKLNDAERDLLICALQALLRERTLAWNIACDMATRRHTPTPNREHFGIAETQDMLRRFGAAPQTLY